MSFTNYRFRSREDLEDKEFFYLAGPYSPKEEDMLNRVLADAERAGRNIAFGGTPTRLEVWQAK